MIRTRTVSLGRRIGLTLVELILVIAIIAVLAALILPKLDGIQSNAGHAVGASSAYDLYGLLEIHKITKRTYPDGWDSLTDGAALWPASDVSTNTRGLHTQLTGNSPTVDKLSLYTLVASDVAAFKKVGITTLFNVDPTPTTSVRPGDMFNQADTMEAGSTVAIINSGSSAGKAIIDRIYPDNAIEGTNAGVSGTIPANTHLIVFGFGAHNKIVGGMVSEVPSYQNVDPALVYNRLLVVFEVTASKATLKTVLGADGDMISDMAAAASKVPS